MQRNVSSPSFMQYKVQNILNHDLQKPIFIDLCKKKKLSAKDFEPASLKIWSPKTEVQKSLKILSHWYNSKKNIFIELWAEQGTKYFEPHIWLKNCMFVKLCAKQITKHFEPHNWFKETYFHWTLVKKEYKTVEPSILIKIRVTSFKFVQNRVQTILNHLFDSKKLFIKLWEKTEYTNLIFTKLSYNTFDSNKCIFMELFSKQMFAKSNKSKNSKSQNSKSQKIIRPKSPREVYTHREMF